MELLLINHPLDCPVCDKGGECPLQNQAMSNGRGESPLRRDVKRTFPKPINISAQVLLDRERCVLCARCTRFSEQIAGDPFIDAARARRAAAGRHLRGAAVRVLLLRQHRPDLPGRRADRRGVPLPRPARSTCVSTPSGLRALRVRAARMRTDHRRGKVMRRLAGDDPAGQRGVELRQGPLGVPLRRRRPTASPTRWCATTTASCVAAGWPEALERRRRAACRGRRPRRRRRAARRPAHRRGRLRLRASSPASRSAPTTSTSAPAPHSRRGGRLPRRARSSARRPAAAS